MEASHGRSHCQLLVIETRQVPSLSVWDISREDITRLQAVSGDSARCGHWALAAIADFDVNQAIVATRDRALQLWDLRALGSPVAVSEPAVTSARAVLNVGSLGTPKARAACSADAGNIHVWDVSGEGGQIKRLQTLFGHVEDLRWMSFDWNQEKKEIVHAASLAIDGETLFWAFPWPEPEEEEEKKGESGSEKSDSPMSPRARERPNRRKKDQWSSMSRRAGAKIVPKMLPSDGGLQSRAVAYEFQDATERPCAISGSSDGALHVWIEGDEEQTYSPAAQGTAAGDGKLLGHVDQVSAVCADFTNEYAVSASLDRTMRVWEVRSSYMECLRVLEGHTASIRTVVADFPQGRALSAGADELARIWDLGIVEGSNDARCLGTLPISGSGIREMLASFPCGLGATVTRDGTLRVWDLERQEQVAMIESHSRGVFAVQIGAESAATSSAPSPDRLSGSSPLPTRISPVSRYSPAPSTFASQHSLYDYGSLLGGDVLQPVCTGGSGWCLSVW